MLYKKPGDFFNAMKNKRITLVPPSKGRKPKGAHGRAAVKALGRTKTTGNFAKIEAKAGKGAAINAFQNALKAHKGKKKRGLRPASAVVKSEQNASHQFYKKGKKKMAGKCKRHNKMACKRCM